MKGCAEIFAERGNPWVSERDRGEMPEMPPSKAHRKRLARGGGAYTEPLPRAKSEGVGTRQLRRQLDVKNALIAALGGSRTVVVR